MNIHSDGLDHINVYSQGKTLLGRMLSNFYHAPIETVDGPFQTIEGYWYWLSTKDDKLRTLSGFEAKRYGRFIKAPDWVDGEDFKNKIKAALSIKINSHPQIKEELIKSHLPLTHYYVYADKMVKVLRGQWIIDHLTELRTSLKNSAT